jgi:hypothetical protein
MLAQMGSHKLTEFIYVLQYILRDTAGWTYKKSCLSSYVYQCLQEYQDQIIKMMRQYLF